MSRTLYIDRSGDVSMPVPSRQAAELHRALDDEPALRAVRTFAADGLAVGECSGVVLAAAEELLTGPHSDAHRPGGVRPGGADHEPALRVDR